MKKTNNNNVVEAWSNGRKAQSHNGNLRTDGIKLYSYGLLIGINKGGNSIAFDYTAPAGHCYSVTTSCHVGRAKRYADEVMNPKVAAAAKLISKVWA